MKPEIIRKLMGVKSLPTLPVMLSRVIETVESGKSSASDLSRVIANDQSISSKVLRCANSAFYGQSKNVKSTQQAAVVLGFDTIKQLALATSMFDSFSRVQSQGTFSRLDFWKHSIGTAKATTLLIHKSHNGDLDRNYTIGLLHDIGKLVMDLFFHSQYEDAIELAAKKSLSINEAEQQVFESDHAEIGAWLAKRWHFPPELLVPLECHHNVEKADKESLASTMLVHTADYVCQKAGIGLSNDQKEPKLKEKLLPVLKLKISDVKNAIKRLKAQEEEIDTLLKSIR